MCPIVATIGCLFAFSAAGGSGPPQLQTSNIELTEVDITTIRGFRAGDSAVFGVSLGMTRDAARAVLSKHPFLLVKADAYYPTRLYVYDRRPDGSAGRSLLYYIWSPDDPALDEIVVFGDFIGYLKGNTKRLLSLESLDPRSSIVKTFLGQPDRSMVTRDFPLADLRDTRYYYDAKGLTITRTHWGTAPDTVVFSLVNSSGREGARSTPLPGPGAVTVLDGCYATRVQVMSLTVIARFAFRRDGTFVEDRPIDGEVVGVPGRYRVRGGTIELAYADGQVRRKAFAAAKTGKIQMGVSTYVLGTGCGTQQGE